MKVLIFIITGFLSSSESYAFFPQISCWLETKEKSAPSENLMPLKIQYLDDGMIEVTFGEDSCELDYVKMETHHSFRWARFSNNNQNLDKSAMNTRCSHLITQFLKIEYPLLADISWLALSDQIINEKKRMKELNKRNPEFSGLLQVFNWTNSATRSTVIFPLSCKIY